MKPGFVEPPFYLDSTVQCSQEIIGSALSRMRGIPAMQAAEPRRATFGRGLSLCYTDSAVDRDDGAVDVSTGARG